MQNTAQLMVVHITEWRSGKVETVGPSSSTKWSRAIRVRVPARAIEDHGLLPFCPRMVVA